MTVNREKFFTAIRPFFGRLTQSQVSNMEGIIDAFDSHGDGKRETLAYALATVYHEVGRNMAPVREGFASSDFKARQAVAALARRRGPNSAPARYGRPAGPYGHVYYGRGYPQLTWLENYQRSSNDAGVDLVRYPDKMLDPVISARVLIRGLIDGRWNRHGKGVSYYLPHDPVGARYTVNVQDKASLIAGYYGKFLDAVYHSWERRPVVVDTPRGGIWAAILRFLRGGK